MSDSNETTADAGGSWRLPKHETGRDDLWDRLGDDWQAIEGVQPEMNVYARWEKAAEGRARITGLCITHPSLTSEELRAIPMGRLAGIPAISAEGAMSRDEFLDALQPLSRRKGEDSEEFANRVAYYYRIFLGISSRPAAEMAEHSGVPVGTVRGWIREARLRGKLPPGKPGRAG